MDSNVQPGESIDLRTDRGLPVEIVRLGLSWDTIKRSRPSGATQEVAVDLDASALLVSADGAVLETVYFAHLSSVDFSVVHLGDNMTGAGDGEDESLEVDFGKIDSAVAHIVFIVTSYSGHRFDEIENPRTVIVDARADDRELVRFAPAVSGDHTAMVIGRFSRAQDSWSFTAIGRPAQARTPRELVPLALASLR